jgi:hypothetical protein
MTMKSMLPRCHPRSPALAALEESLGGSWTSGCGKGAGGTLTADATARAKSAPLPARENATFTVLVLGRAAYLPVGTIHRSP